MLLMRYALLFIVGTTMSLFLLTACIREEKKPVAPNSHEQGVKKQTTVVEPSVSKGKWRAVVIGVTDKQTGKEFDCEVVIGSQSSIPESNISIAAENFLPHFIMQGTVLTSQSNEPKNPAVQIKVFEGGKEIFKGWLFALYPTTHAFQHSRYSFSLKGFSPAK